MGVILVSHLPITCYERQDDLEFGDTAVHCITTVLFGFIFQILHISLTLSLVTKKKKPKHPLKWEFVLEARTVSFMNNASFYRLFQERLDNLPSSLT